jgi:hypothetical protein
MLSNLFSGTYGTLSSICTVKGSQEKGIGRISQYEMGIARKVFGIVTLQENEEEALGVDRDADQDSDNVCAPTLTGGHTQTIWSRSKNT